MLSNQYLVGPGGLLPAYPVSNLIVAVLGCLPLGANGPSRAAAVYAKAFLLARVACGILVPNAEEPMLLVLNGVVLVNQGENATVFLNAGWNVRCAGICL